ncbi:MAG: proline--tRNA ligase [Alphaproteobacteria bacterium RIFCSPHIGHO2_01_FULL_41_14]|nr:MAG: proline--tRNA ligase [Alphaproteobacteria bacterium GWB1_45_5]OFW75856.1 MAG: proline--tRNA ligase [Alphaproteobacteria bacterium GWA1_45_9]OFW89945.1 MAG: proline--tRNA ligase [Alphaproteobacteria bacterium RIFCSPHIGHO2_01_FULL_41_14]
MKLSQYFLPTLKENPSEAQVTSHRLMLRAGMICQDTVGIYSWLPFGLKVLQKVEQVIREEQDKIGCQEVLMPLLQNRDLWRESGRDDAYGKEMLRLQDRHEREMVFAPSSEEVVHDLFRRHLQSYKDLPKCLYQIHWKFRDEVRPRFGIMRGREFLMKDGYSFDLDAKAARETYKSILRSYLRIFKRLGLVVLPMRADTGPIGGDLSHEFHVIAQTGESGVFYDKKYDLLKENIESIDVEDLLQLYASTDELHDPSNCPISKEDLKEARGIEVGHIFYYGDKYTKAMNITVMGPEGMPVYPEGGCYGIGVSRVVGAMIEASHDERGIVWPESVSPFLVGLINVKVKDPAVSLLCEDLYTQLMRVGISVLYDDRDEGAGSKFSNMDLIGLPWQMIIGPRSLLNKTVELKNRRTGHVHEVSVDTVLSFLKDALRSVL